MSMTVIAASPSYHYLLAAASDKWSGLNEVRSHRAICSGSNILSASARQNQRSSQLSLKNDYSLVHETLAWAAQARASQNASMNMTAKCDIQMVDEHYEKESWLENIRQWVLAM